MVGEGDDHQKESRQHGGQDQQSCKSAQPLASLVYLPVMVRRNGILMGKLPFQSRESVELVHPALVMSVLFRSYQVFRIIKDEGLPREIPETRRRNTRSQEDERGKHAKTCDGQQALSHHSQTRLDRW